MAWSTICQQELTNAKALVDEFDLQLPLSVAKDAEQVAAQTAATVAEATMIACCMRDASLSKQAAKSKLSATWTLVRKQKDEFKVDVVSMIHPVVASAATERALG